MAPVPSHFRAKVNITLKQGFRKRAFCQVLTKGLDRRSMLLKTMCKYYFETENKNKMYRLFLRWVYFVITGSLFVSHKMKMRMEWIVNNVVSFCQQHKTATTLLNQSFAHSLLLLVCQFHFI